MTHWMCITCGYYFQAPQPPNRCPSCNQICAFNDVTCYRPECGGERNVDPLLVGGTLGMLTGPKAKQTKTEPTLTTMETMPLAEIMSGLNEKQRQQVTRAGRIENYEKDAVICTEGAESRKLYLLEEGEVAVHSELGKGMRIPISVVLPGHAFGWSALVPPYRLTATVVALSKVRVISIERDALLALMQANPSMGCTIMENVAGVIASRLRNLELELVGLVQKSSR